jgi:hypothetical protein
MIDEKLCFFIPDHGIYSVFFNTTLWDWSFSYTMGKQWELIGEAGYFKRGYFFKDEQGHTPEPIRRILTGINVGF